MNVARLLLAAAPVGFAAAASAQVVIEQSTVAPPTHATSLNFDEPGQATGSLPATYWQAEYGLVIDAGDGNPVVDNWSTIFGPWLGTGNSFFGNFGVFITFDSEVVEFAAQVWDPSGPPGPIGGGLFVGAFLNGAEVASGMYTPAWGTDVDSWFDIHGENGATFDEVRILGFGFDPSTFADNLSWTAVPAHGVVAIFGLAGLARGRRRF